MRTGFESSDASKENSGKYASTSPSMAIEPAPTPSKSGVKLKRSVGGRVVAAVKVRRVSNEKEASSLLLANSFISESSLRVL